MVATAIRQTCGVAPLENEHDGESLLSAVAEATDEELAQRTFAGDREAANVLLQRYRAPLFGVLLRLCHNTSDAEELFQEAFLRALSAKDRYDPERRFKPWLFTIALNLARDRLKRNSHPATPELHPNHELPEPRGRDHERDWVDRADLLRAMSRLSDAHREVVMLKYFEGLEEPEIAAATGVPRGTVKSRLHHALRKLRDLLGKTS
jgi:RNA polymerase sigma-70 factor (ECF subfamily)